MKAQPALDEGATIVCKLNSEAQADVTNRVYPGLD